MKKCKRCQWLGPGAVDMRGIGRKSLRGLAVAYGERVVICNLSEEIQTLKMKLHHSENPLLASTSSLQPVMPVAFDLEPGIVGEELVH